MDAIGRGIPFLGICVGMQWMFAGSEESLETRGLGVFDGECQRFAASVKSPHVGWNQLEVRSSVAAAARSAVGLRLYISPTHFAHRRSMQRWRVASTASDSLPLSNGTTCLECSFIPKNPGRSV